MAKSEKKKDKPKAKTTTKADSPPQKPETTEVMLSKLDMRFRDEIAGHPGGENIRRCFACGTCAAGCPVTDVDSEYNCRRIIRQILLGMRDEVLSSPLIWLCLVCYRCYVRCPQKVNFTDIMRVLRYLAVKEKRVSAETFERINELDRLSQVVRHDLVKGLVFKERVTGGAGEPDWNSYEGGVGAIGVSQWQNKRHKSNQKVKSRALKTSGRR